MPRADADLSDSGIRKIRSFPHAYDQLWSVPNLSAAIKGPLNSQEIVHTLVHLESSEGEKLLLK